MHYEVSTNIDLIHSNLTRLIKSNDKYHWLVDLCSRFNLPLFSGMHDVNTGECHSS